MAQEHKGVVVPPAVVVLLFLLQLLASMQH
jgi:hypothetical protein